MQRIAERAAAIAAPTVTVGVNEDIDWTPPAQQVFARNVTVKQGPLQVLIEEARYPNGVYGFCLGVGDGKEKTRFNLCWIELDPLALDALVDLLVIARDKARELGMPSVDREATS